MVNIVNTVEVKNSIIYVAQTFISGLFAILLYPIITDTLEPRIFGVYALSVVYASIAIGISNFGCIVGYERNYFLVEKSEQDTGYLLVSTQAFVCFLFFIVILAGWLTRDTVSLFLFDTSDYSDLWWLMLFATGFASLAQYYLAYLKNSGMAGTFFKMTVLQVSVNFLLVYLLLLYTDHGVMSLAYAFLISNVILCLFLFVHQFMRLSFGFRISLLADVLKVSLPLTPKVLFGFLNTQFDKIMLGMLSSMGGVGIYTIAQRIALSVFSFMTALDRVFKPNVYRMLFFKEERKDIGKYLIPYIYIAMLPALIIVLFSSEIINLLVSESYSGSVSILIVMCLYYSLMFFGKITSTQLICAKQTWLTSKLMLWGVLLNIALNIPMIIFWGAIGAALATALSSFLMMWVYYYFAQKFAKITWEFKTITCIYSLLLFSAFYVIGFENDYFSTTRMMYLIGKLIITLLFIFIGWKIEFLNKNNIMHVYGIVRSHFFNFNQKQT